MADIELRRQADGVFARAFAAPLVKAIPRDLRMPESRGGWYPIVREGFAGAWQQNIETPIADVLSHPTVYRSLATISGDVAKMRLRLVQDIGNDVWIPVENPAFSPLLRRPNHYQTPFQFVQAWMLSKLESGNTYVLQQRDGRDVVIAQYPLDPWRVRPLIAPDGSVFYELKPDNLNQIPELPGPIVVPASEIIHDRMNCLFHPLVGIPPLYAAGIPAILGLKIVTNSAHFFANGASPGGILTWPGAIDPAQATQLKADWETNFGGVNSGRVAVLGDGLKYESVAVVTSDKAQTAEQWDKASQAIADAFCIPWFLVGGPQAPYGTNPQAVTIQYYSQCLQPHTRSFEEVYELGIGLSPDRINGQRLGVEFNTADLLLMDAQTQMATLSQGVGAGVYAINEARSQVNLPPVEGGAEPIVQQQNWPLSVLAKRPPPDATPPAVAEPAANEDDDEEMMDEDQMQAAALALHVAPFRAMPANALRAELALKAV